MNQLHRSRD